MSQILSPHSQVVICFSSYTEFAEISHLDGGNNGWRRYRITRLSVYFSIPSVLPDLPSQFVTGFTLLTFVGTEWLKDRTGMQRRAMHGEMWQLEVDVEGFGPWDLFPQSQYSQSWSRNSLVLQISKSSHTHTIIKQVIKTYSVYSNRLPNSTDQVAFSYRSGAIPTLRAVTLSASSCHTLEGGGGGGGKWMTWSGCFLIYSRLSRGVHNSRQIHWLRCVCANKASYFLFCAAVQQSCALWFCAPWQEKRPINIFLAG